MSQKKDEMVTKASVKKRLDHALALRLGDTRKNSLKIYTLLDSTSALSDDSPLLAHINQIMDGFDDTTKVEAIIGELTTGELTKFSSNIYSSKKEFKNARAHGKTDFHDSIFMFSDFTGLDLSNCQFEKTQQQTEMGNQAAPTKKAENISDDGFDDANDPSVTAQNPHAIFLVQPNFDGAKLKKGCFISDENDSDITRRREYLKAMFPMGYQNDDHLFNYVSVEACENSIAEGGLDFSQLCAVLEQMQMNPVFGKKTGTHAVAVLPNSHSRVSYTKHVSINASVINIERVLDLTTTPSPDTTITSNQFAAFLEQLKKTSEQTITCIQLPISIREAGRAHYAHLQIFQKEKGQLVARIIDSTFNPLGHPTDEIKKMLEKNEDTLSALLLSRPTNSTDSRPTNSTDKVVVEKIYTGVQSSWSWLWAKKDKKCGLYVMGGIRASTENYLNNGSRSLLSEDPTKEIIKKEHERVREASPSDYIMEQEKGDAEDFRQYRKEITELIQGLAEPTKGLAKPTKGVAEQTDDLKPGLVDLTITTFGSILIRKIRCANSNFIDIRAAVNEFRGIKKTEKDVGSMCEQVLKKIDICEMKMNLKKAIRKSTIAQEETTTAQKESPIEKLLSECDDEKSMLSLINKFINELENQNLKEQCVKIVLNKISVAGAQSVFGKYASDLTACENNIQRYKLYVACEKANKANTAKADYEKTTEKNPQKKINLQLAKIKAELEYRKTLYEIRSETNGFFSKLFSWLPPSASEKLAAITKLLPWSASRKLAATIKMINHVNNLTSPSSSASKLEDSWAAKDGKLGVIFNELDNVAQKPTESNKTSNSQIKPNKSNNNTSVSSSAESTVVPLENPLEPVSLRDSRKESSRESANSTAGLGSSKTAAKSTDSNTGSLRSNEAVFNSTNNSRLLSNPSNSSTETTSNNLAETNESKKNKKLLLPPKNVEGSFKNALLLKIWINDDGSEGCFKQGHVRLPQNPGNYMTIQNGNTKILIPKYISIGPKEKPEKFYYFSNGTFNAAFRNFLTNLHNQNGDDSAAISNLSTPPAVLKLPLPQEKKEEATELDTAERAARVFNACNKTALAADKKNEPFFGEAKVLGNGWLAPYINGKQANDKEICQRSIELFNETQRIVVDSYIRNNLLTDKNNITWVIDPGLAIQLGSNDPTNADAMQEKSPNSKASFCAWNKNNYAEVYEHVFLKLLFPNEYKQKFRSKSVASMHVENTIPLNRLLSIALLYIQKTHVDVKDVSCLKNEELTKTFAAAYIYELRQKYDLVDQHKTPAPALKILKEGNKLTGIDLTEDEKRTFEALKKHYFPSTHTSITSIVTEKRQQLPIHTTQNNEALSLSRT